MAKTTIECPTCWGGGEVKDKKGNIKSCSTCKGEGEITVNEG